MGTISQLQAEGEKIYTVILRDITVRKQAHEALRESEERYRNLFNTMNEGFCIIEMIFDGEGKPADYRFLQVNPAFERQTGLHEAEGKLMRELAPAHEAHWFEIYGRVAITGEPVHFLNEARALNRWYHVHAYRVGEPEMRRVAIIFNDFSDYQRAQQALQASEDRWATTLQSIGDAVISTDAAGNIEFMNDVAQNLTGWSLPEAKGHDLSAAFNIVQEVTRVKPENPVAKVIRLGKVVGLANHTALIRRDGTEIPIEDSGAPIRNREGQIEGVVLVFHDVSEQRKVEKALRNSDRLATTGRLAATIAHEIHNPLDSVGNLLFLIGQATPEESTRQYVSMASQELVRVTQMTQQMLSFQREAAKPIPVKIKDILDNVIALYDRKIQSAGIKLKQQVDFDGHILALPGELRQMFANLVGNAIEAVGPRRGTITLRAYASRDWRRERSGLRVIVADDGPGIPADVRTSIFEPFFTTKGESGTGLGLWITSDILRKYDGTMRLRTSTQPRRSGTCFSVFFPFETSADSPQRA
jgi:PAS domain S-box-containing protein